MTVNTVIAMPQYRVTRLHCGKLSMSVGQFVAELGADSGSRLFSNKWEIWLFFFNKKASNSSL